MTTLKIKKAEISEISAVQNIIFKFLNYKNATLKSSKNRFDDIILIEILTGLYFNFRGKIENKKAVFCDFSLSPAQAVAVLYCCSSSMSDSSNFEGFVCEKYKNLVHQHLINFL